MTRTHLVALALAMGAVACADGGTQPGDLTQPLPGVYQLDSVGGRALPALLRIRYTGGLVYTDSVTAEVATLRQDGSYVRVTTIKQRLDGSSSVELTSEGAGGTYSVTGDSITVNDLRRGTLRGSVRGGVLRLPVTQAFTYRRVAAP